MTLIFRSNSFDGPRVTGTASFPPSNDDDEEEEEEEEENDEEEEEEEENDEYFVNPTSSSFLSSPEETREQQEQQFSILAIFVAALRKSLVTCSVDREDMCSMDIGWPTDVRHIAHVTFDRFNGFLGLPVEFEPEVPRRVPSASVSVFGVSAKSMQCSYDHRGNSVPTILLLMQRRLYSQGGLLAEGIFRINAENGQEEYLRNQLNRGIIPHGIDLHCLAGLIKAWFRELPTGVLDSLTPEQVMHCNTEENCAQLVMNLPPTEAALLDWAINLMADVVQHEDHNKMNARNIAMVFAPNMTQMADPLTALIHAVQVMNFLKTLILKTLREREESSTESRVFSSCSESPSSKAEPNSSSSTARIDGGAITDKTDARLPDKTALGKFLLGAEDRVASDAESFRSFQTKSEADEERELISDGSPHVKHAVGTMENRCGGGYGSSDVEGLLDRLSWRKGVRRLCRHPVFQLSKLVKKGGSLGVVNSRGRGGEAWA
ncbi:rho GTPase-activating protein 3-like [Magnolia sinica]|uniref:rho GTPase-activating protein 3-like n=1 Tax=Magnolia sinica TaxID=86752 RepID=UPI00265A5A4C|nr:rho GTPase-activating protein 3-like [Magnolia sinica]